MLEKKSTTHGKNNAKKYYGGSIFKSRILKWKSPLLAIRFLYLGLAMRDIGSINFFFVTLLSAQVQPDGINQS
jgi:hypothetical protein